MKPNNGGGILRVTLIAGLILLVLAGIFFAGIKIFERRSATAAKQKEDNFYGILREYDISARVFIGTEKEYEKLNSELNRLEKRAIGVESWLSILKRRRALAGVYPPSTGNYHESIRRARKAYPLSQPLAAIAAAALVRDTALTREGEAELRNLLSLIDSPSFNTLRLGLHILLGDFTSPRRSAQLPQELFSDGTEAITVDLIITRILRADYRGASSEIQTVLNSPFPPSTNLIRLAAEYYYDFGDLSRSAELFSHIDDESAMIRQADALYLAGFPRSARSIWTILADSSNENGLYNLAVTSENRNEAAAWLEKLVNLRSASNSDSRQFGLIRYSRLLPYNQAIAALENTENLNPERFPFIDLEICKRHSEGQALGRQMAQAWLLLDRHPDNEELYQWVTWFTFFQRFYGEGQILLKRLKYEWAPSYEAVLMIQEGDLEKAKDILSEAAAAADGDAEWTVYANLGRILESQRSIARALEQYELAAAKAQDPKTASRLQVRIARCFTALGRPTEARRVLQYALDLDSENLSARLELDRIFQF